MSSMVSKMCSFSEFVDSFFIKFEQHDGVLKTAHYCKRKMNNTRYLKTGSDNAMAFHDIGAF